jgi:hypothetical protein
MGAGSHRPGLLPTLTTVRLLTDAYACAASAVLTAAHTRSATRAIAPGSQASSWVKDAT